MNNNRHCILHIFDAVGSTIDIVKRIKQLDADLAVPGRQPLDTVELLYHGFKDTVISAVEAGESLTAYSECASTKPRSLPQAKKKTSYYRITGIGLAEKKELPMYALPMGLYQSK